MFKTQFKGNLTHTELRGGQPFLGNRYQLVMYMLLGALAANGLQQGA